MERYVCIHGHFYQPPRENPWLEAIEVQDSAYPYHDWNARITAECYAPNAAARILDEQGRVARIVNTYSRISFNFGPTLLAWLERSAPDTYAAILEADRQSRLLYSGHGSALAQAYNHMILPLANHRDRETQVIWGIRDFEHRFGRRPEGMWLPETAVDLETLRILADHGIRFTILSPYQARRAREIGAAEWEPVPGGGIDPSRPYRAAGLGAGRELALFFYDGPISQAVAFQGLLSSGEYFAQRLLGGFDDARDWPQLVHIATDGETYGHHHRYGDMALAYALQYLEANAGVVLTNYGEHLERVRPTHEAEIQEDTSWSCAHGVERWRGNCGCNSGGHGDWTQLWRGPLRQALDWLRDSVTPHFEQVGGRLLLDPWAARDDYISVVLDRAPDTVDAFLARHAARPVGTAEATAILQLMELQRHALLMYTSCGWFFDEISGIETVQVLQYAGRVVQLAQELFGESLEPSFLQRLELAPSNVPELRTGAQVYLKQVKPAMVGLPRVAAHYAAMSLFEAFPARSRIYCYTVERDDARSSEAGRARVAIGRARVTSDITRESAALSYGMLHFGDHNLNGGVRRYRGSDAYEGMADAVIAAFERAELPEVIRLLDRYFERTTFSLQYLFKDEQRKILDRILGSTVAEIEADYRQIADRHAPLMRYLKNLELPLPAALRSAAEITLRSDLRRAFSREPVALARVQALLREAAAWGIPIEPDGLGLTITETLEREAERLRDAPTDLRRVRDMQALIAQVRALPFAINLWWVQNIYYDLLGSCLPEQRLAAARGDEQALAWLRDFTALGDALYVRVEP